MPNVITCPANCASALSAVSSNYCAPNVIGGEIQRIFLGLPGEDFDAPATPDTGIDDVDAWTTRLDDTAVADEAIIQLPGIGERTEPEVQSAKISLGRTIQKGRKFKIEFEVDDISPDTHKFMQKLEKCGGNYNMWYETAGLKLFGSHDGVEKGIRVSINPRFVIPRDKAGYTVWKLTIEWEATHSECFINSVVPLPS